jgi:hypothetical protein
VLAPLPPPYDAPLPPAPPKAPSRSEWGAQVRFEGVAMPKEASPDAGMAGGGFSLRPRPSPFFAIDFGVDFIGGRDFNLDKRSEAMVSVNPTLFINPRNKVQVYLFAGLGLGGAHVERRDGTQGDARYVGANAGAGLEFRFWQHFAFSGDVLGFVRERIAMSGTSPANVDPTAGPSDGSRGTLFRVGGTYYW